MIEEGSAEQGQLTAPSNEAARPAKVTFLTVLGNPGFRNLWLGQIISQMGDYFAFLALLVVISGFASSTADTTRDVSGIMIAVTLPRLLFGVLAGVFVDRWDRRLTMIASDFTRAVIVLALIPAFLSRSTLLIYVLAFLLSSAGTFFNPAKGALIPRLVPQGQLTSANALSQTSQMLATLIGPALAGLTFAMAGEGNQWIAFLIDAVSFFVSGVAVWSITAYAGAVPTVQALASTSARSALRRVLDELVVGLRALLLSRTMAAISGIVAITWLGIGAINVLWIVFLKTSFGYQSVELAWRISLIDIVFSAGMVGISIAIGNFLSHIAPKWLVTWGLVGTGLITAVVGFLPNYWAVVAAMLLVGAFVAPIGTGTNTLMQIVVRNEQLGRVGGGVNTIADAAGLLSMSLAGVLGVLLGIPVVFFLGGLLCAMAGVCAWLTLPAFTPSEIPAVDKNKGNQQEAKNRPAASGALATTGEGHVSEPVG
ncbi:MAG TPA: MFS transporter [Chloroflexia bacterium]|nr:MFS transporter [Chloroflexia bacterium]